VARLVRQAGLRSTVRCICGCAIARHPLKRCKSDECWRAVQADKREFGSIMPPSRLEAQL